MGMKLIYRLSDRQVMGYGTHSAPSEGEGVLELSDDATATINILAGYTAILDADLNITTSAPVASQKETDLATAKQVVVDAATLTDKRNAMVDYLIQLHNL